jgi:surface antigen
MMLNKTITLAAAMVAVAAMSGLAGQPAVAQYGPPNQYPDRNYQSQYQDRGPPSQNRNSAAPSNQYDDGYREGYRAGYDAARNTQRYDDRPDNRAEIGGTRGDPNARWRQRYAQSYTYNDDNYYRSCRNSPDPAGVIAGALIGGLLGNAASRGNGGATVAGVILGGVTGAALTRNLDCEDQSYAYKTYYDGFNSGRPNSDYQWRNPSNGHYGNFRVVSYANDPDGFRCANFSQQIYINERPQVSTGRACQQPDGSWTIVG